MKWRKTITRPPWRTIIPGIGLLLFAMAVYGLWSPGLDIRDGRHDRNHNGIWLGHGWLGGDDWFVRNDKTNQLPKFHDPKNISTLAQKLGNHHITDVYPHLCPAGLDGSIPTVNATQAELFLDEFKDFRVMPWIGGPLGSDVRLRDAKWRDSFCESIQQLFKTHPRFAGVQINIEPMPGGNQDFLRLLEQIRSILPKGKLLSVAAYPPPTRWHPYEDVHWNEAYFRQVAARCDQMVVMMYDTGIRIPKLYQRLMADWTREVLSWSDGKAVLLGVPTYSDEGVEYHNPKVENLSQALLGIHRGLIRQPLRVNYQGVAIYCEWETDDAEWQYLAEHFLSSRTPTKE